MRCEFTTDLPTELSWIPEFSNVEEVKNWLLKALIWHLIKCRIVPEMANHESVLLLSKICPIGLKFQLNQGVRMSFGNL